MIGVIKTDIPEYNWNESLFTGDFHARTTFDGEMDRTSNMGILWCQILAYIIGAYLFIVKVAIS